MMKKFMLDLAVAVALTGCFSGGSGSSGDGTDEFPKGASKGSGVFAESTSMHLTQSDNSTAVAVGDLDKDASHTDDIVVANKGGPTSRIYYTTASSSTSILLNPPVDLEGSSGGCNSVQVGDLDGDGNLDIILGCSPGGSRVYWNKTNKSFSGYLLSDLLSTSVDACSTTDINKVKLVDADGDKKMDFLITAGTSGACIYQVISAGSFVQFQLKRNIAGGAGSVSIAVCDLNADSLLDIVLGRDPSSTVVFLATDANYNLGFVNGDISSSMKAYDVICFQKLTRTLLDVLAGATGAQSRLWVNGGDGKTFTSSSDTFVAGGKNVRTIVAADFNADTYPDLFFGVTGNQTDELYLWNSGSNAFEDKSTNIAGLSAANTNGAVAVDIDRNGTLDLVVVRNGNSAIFLNAPQ